VVRVVAPIEEKSMLKYTFVADPEYIPLTVLLRVAPILA
jgi:hypothetical protein